MRVNNGEEHQRLIKHLQKTSDAGLRKLGYNYLSRLRALRNRADYVLDIEFTRESAKEALERATEIITGFLPK